jgi:hypothetical protein
MNFKVRNVSTQLLSVLVRDEATETELFNNRLDAGEQTPTLSSSRIFVRIHRSPPDESVIPILKPDHTDETPPYYLVEIR